MRKISKDNSLVNRLNCRVALYGPVETKNELNEVDYDYVFIKHLWAEIQPQNGKLTEGQANTIFSEISHKFTIRSNAVKELRNDMYFMYAGQRYDIKFFYPNFKWKDRLEIFCEAVIE